MVRNLVGSILIISLGTIAVASEQPTVLEFRQEMMDHRARVVQTALLIYTGHSHAFPALKKLHPEIARRLIDVYMSLHDAPKTMSQSELKKLGYTGDVSLLKLLHGIWGQHVDPKPAFIQELNILEDKLKQERMAIELAGIDLALQEKVMTELQTIEVAADVTDTKIFRGKELNFIRTAFSAEKFLQASGQMLAASLSRWYETRYHPMRISSCRKTHMIK